MKIIISFFIFYSSFFLYAQNIPTHQYKIGGQEIIFPNPGEIFKEASNDEKEMLEFVVPKSNKLITAYISENESKSEIKTGYPKYALIEVLRRTEYLDLNDDDFKTMVNKLKMVPDDYWTSGTDEVEKEFIERIKAEKLEDIKIDIDINKQLGCFFSIQDAYGFGLLATLEFDGKRKLVANLTILLKVKNRFVIIYLYSDYEDIGTITWLRRIGKKWSEEIIKINKESK